MILFLLGLTTSTTILLSIYIFLNFKSKFKNNFDLYESENQKDIKDPFDRI